MSKWYKLDNAAKIFPVLYSKNDTNSFRVSVIFKNEINFLFLDKALEQALNRFPMYCVKIKRGAFWYYFDHNYEKPIILKEDSIFFNSVRLRKNNGYMFTLSHYGKRLTLEIFHALSDGTGGIEFLKTICFYYLLECGIEINNTGEIKTEEIERSLRESEDSFSSHYDKRTKKYGTEGKAYHIKGTFYDKNYYGIVNAILSVKELKEISKKFHATITEYIGANILFSIYQNYFKKNPSNKKVKLFIPVNARKYFNSVSMRNFVLYVRTNCDFNDKKITFIDCIKYMKETFEHELTKDKLSRRLASNVGFEKKIIVRLLPLFIKNFFMKIGYKILGSDSNTISFSNLGIVTLPVEMMDHLTRFEFIIGTSKKAPTNLAAVSYQDIFCLTFSTKIIEKDLIQGIVRKLSADGLNVIVETNDLEVEE